MLSDFCLAALMVLGLCAVALFCFSSRLFTSMACASALSFLVIVGFGGLFLNPILVESGFFYNLSNQPSLEALTGLQVSFLMAGVFTSLVYFTLVLAKGSPASKAVFAWFGVINLAGAAMVLTPSLLIFFFSFELLLFSSLGLLRLTAKTERVLEAAQEMFFWTLSGSIVLLPAFSLLWASSAFLFSDLFLQPSLDVFHSFLFFWGFGVKVPLWPCFSWLLKAHVEASVEFSILLSGLIVKLGAFGIAQFAPHAHPEALFCLAGLCLLAMIDVTSRLWAQRDLKRIVALTTVFEMNWLALSLAWSTTLLQFAAALLVVAHSLTTATEFFLVECISRRWGTRDFTEIRSVAFDAPLLGFLAMWACFVTVGFPGTSLFLIKLFFFFEIASLFLGLFFFLVFIFFVCLPIFFFRLWVLLLFGQSTRVGLILDLTRKEAAILAFPLACGSLLGCFPGLFF